MNEDFYIDHEEFARHVRDAERMRAAALSALIFGARVKAKAFCVSLATLARSTLRRRRWNLSVPAPHH
ncbi:MAG TPA: hypothetical protein PLW68_11240 [Casimicrobiaceae bacterium]|nr:hypothetical protein [Casimicrobiaceae bacterium]